jgi:hypothetical protein
MVTLTDAPEETVPLEFNAETMINLMIFKPKSDAPGDVGKATCHSISGQRGHPGSSESMIAYEMPTARLR